MLAVVSGRVLYVRRPDSVLDGVALLGGAGWVRACVFIFEDMRHAVH